MGSLELNIGLSLVFIREGHKVYAVTPVSLSVDIRFVAPLNGLSAHSIFFLFLGSRSSLCLPDFFLLSHELISVFLTFILIMAKTTATSLTY